VFGSPTNPLQILRSCNGAWTWPLELSFAYLKLVWLFPAKLRRKLHTSQSREMAGTSTSFPYQVFDISHVYGLSINPNVRRTHERSSAMSAHIPWDSRKGSDPSSNNAHRSPSAGAGPVVLVGAINAMHAGITSPALQSCSADDRTGAIKCGLLVRSAHVLGLCARIRPRRDVGDPGPRLRVLKPP
jgi:hypothetical protein